MKTNKKIRTEIFHVPGTRSSIQNNQLISQIGIPSIDNFLGGGLPIGGVCLIGQDKKSIFADIINRCFIAEGVCHKHSLYVCDPNEEIKNVLKKIPTANEIQEIENPKNKDNLRIAWRYSSIEEGNKSLDNELNSLNLTSNYFRNDKFTPIDDILSNCKVREFEQKIQNSKFSYLYLANDLKEYIDLLNLNVKKTKKLSNVLRIVLNSLGGIFYNELSSLNDEYSNQMCRFLLFLRNLMRNSLGICLVVLPYEITTNMDIMKKFLHLVDYAFIMDDSVKTISRISNTEFDGLFRLLKIPHLNSFNSFFTPPTLDLAFSYRKKRLVVEQMHLFPEIDDKDKSYAKGRTNTSITTICNSNTLSASLFEFSKKNQFDF